MPARPVGRKRCRSPAPSVRQSGPSEGDVASFHDQARPSLRIDPRSLDGIDLSLRDPTGLGATLSDMDPDVVAPGEVQALLERRHPLAADGLGNARADQVRRITRQDDPDRDAGLPGAASEMERDGGLGRVVGSPGGRYGQNVIHGTIKSQKHYTCLSSTTPSLM